MSARQTAWMRQRRMVRGRAGGAAGPTHRLSVKRRRMGGLRRIRGPPSRIDGLDRAATLSLITKPEAGELTDEPRVLAMAARAHLRRKFLSAKVAVSGANFGVAETGTLAVVESEGNGRMCLTLPKTLITVMGIEKIVPSFADLEVFMQLLPRSSTAERMNPYTSMWNGVYDGDGPREFHLVLLDDGRTAVMADEVARAALHCIRCSACLNVPGIRAHRRTRLRLGLSRPHRRDPVPAADRNPRPRRPERDAAVRVVVVWGMLRRLPGANRYSVDLGASAGRTMVPRDLGRQRLGADRRPENRRRGGRVLQPPADGDYLPTWHTQRQPGSAVDADEQAAATKAAAHAETTNRAYFYILGRPFLTVAHNKVVRPDHPLHDTQATFHTRVELDIQGNQRELRDADQQASDPLGRIVMRYAYDMLGNRIQQLSMEAGARWTLNDVTGNPIRVWDSRGRPCQLV